MTPLTQGILDEHGAMVKVSLVSTNHQNIVEHIANIARASTNRQTITPDPVKDERLVIRLLQDKHTSPFEFIQFTFHIDAPVMVWWQLVRHRTFSYSMQSGRYTEYHDELSALPIWRKQGGTANKQSGGALINKGDVILWDAKFTQHFQNSIELYKEALENGIAREVARVFLPAFMMSVKGNISCDLHNLIHMLRLRLADDSQLEIRIMAHHILSLIYPLAPLIFDYSGFINRDGVWQVIKPD